MMREGLPLGAFGIQYDPTGVLSLVNLIGSTGSGPYANYMKPLSGATRRYHLPHDWFAPINSREV